MTPRLGAQINEVHNEALTEVGDKVAKFTDNLTAVSDYFTLRYLRSFEIQFELAIWFDSKGIGRFLNWIGRAWDFAGCKLSQTTQTINGA